VSSLLEILELLNGEIVLQQVGSDESPLVTIRFSDEAKAFIGGAQVQVVKAMIQAGIEAASSAQSDAASEKDFFEEVLADNSATNESSLSEAKDEESEGNQPELDTATQIKAQDEAKETVDVATLPEGAEQVNKQRLGPVRPADLSASRVLH